MALIDSRKYQSVKMDSTKTEPQITPTVIVIHWLLLLLLLLLFYVIIVIIIVEFFFLLLFLFLSWLVMFVCLFTLRAI